MANYAQCALLALVYRDRNEHVVISGHSDGTFTWSAALPYEPGAISHAELLQSFHALLGEPAQQAKVLVVVDGGVADYCAHGPALVRIVDRDNEPEATVPSDWESLGSVFGIPATPPPRDPPTKRVIGKGSTQIRVMRDDTLRFRYELKLHSPGDYFECSLFSEIGEPYKAQMRELMAEFNLVLGTPKELAERPWFADTVGSISQ
jgi:hypothetical protein